MKPRKPENLLKEKLYIETLAKMQKEWRRRKTTLLQCLFCDTTFKENRYTWRHMREKVCKRLVNQCHRDENRGEKEKPKQVNDMEGNQENTYLKAALTNTWDSSYSANFFHQAQIKIASGYRPPAPTHTMTELLADIQARKLVPKESHACRLYTKWAATSLVGLASATKEYYGDALFYSKQETFEQWLEARGSKIMDYLRSNIKSAPLGEWRDIMATLAEEAGGG